MNENLSFNNSKTEVGLQIADNLVTIIRRAFNGNLGIDGWEYFGKLMIYDKRGTIKMISLNPKISHDKAPYYHVIDQIEKHAQPMMKS